MSLIKQRGWLAVYNRWMNAKLYERAGTDQTSRRLTCRTTQRPERQPVKKSNILCSH